MEGDVTEAAVKADNLLPVSLLCGFLGAGKTTLLKHILETKHSEEGFKCAVIVNDMAALNIDKSLIDQSAMIQSDKVIAMQNGCFCCTLQNDLVDQIIELAETKMFNYMLLEASGVSEPSQIAPLFDLCDDQHNHEEEHKEGPQLGEVARLDTAVTVIDGAEFYNNLESMKHYEEEGEQKGIIAELLMEQVEYSNVVILNKTDLVNEGQQEDILDRISILNPKAKVLKSCQSKVDVMEILNTQLFSKEDITENGIFATAAKVEAQENAASEMLDPCCEESLGEGGKKCCKSKARNGQLIDSGLSKVTLGVTVGKNDKSLTRHEERFGISSFIYRARRPFHPGRLHDRCMDPYFMTQLGEKEEIEKKPDIAMEQAEAAYKQRKRTSIFGGLMRSKGFVWIATSHFFMGFWQQAGNILTVGPARPWLSELRHLWEGTPSEEMAMKELLQENGEEWPHGDRCQELVFIGKDLNHEEIQKLLDRCLLRDVEMEMGPRRWYEAWYESVDKIKLPTKMFLNDYVEELEALEVSDDGAYEALERGLSFSIRNERPVKEITMELKERVKKDGLLEQEAVSIIWSSVTTAVEWTKIQESDLQEQTIKHFKKYISLFSAFTNSSMSEMVLCNKIQKFCYENHSFFKFFDKIMLLFYKTEVLSEEVILKWHREGHIAQGWATFGGQMKKFIEWLEQAESDEEEDGEQNEDNQTEKENK